MSRCSFCSHFPNQKFYISTVSTKLRNVSTFSTKHHYVLTFSTKFWYFWTFSTQGKKSSILFDPIQICFQQSSICFDFLDRHFLILIVRRRIDMFRFFRPKMAVSTVSTFSTNKKKFQYLYNISKICFNQCDYLCNDYVNSLDQKNVSLIFN